MTFKRILSQKMDQDNLLARLSNHISHTSHYIDEMNKMNSLLQEAYSEISQRGSEPEPMRDQRNEFLRIKQSPKRISEEPKENPHVDYRKVNTKDSHLGQSYDIVDKGSIFGYQKSGDYIDFNESCPTSQGNKLNMLGVYEHDIFYDDMPIKTEEETGPEYQRRLSKWHAEKRKGNQPKIRVNVSEILGLDRRTGERKSVNVSKIMRKNYGIGGSS